MPLPLLAIGAAAGALAGAWSVGDQYRREREGITRQQGYARDAYRYQSEYNEGMWELQRGEALETLGIQQNRLAQAFGADVAGFNLGLQGQACQAQGARIALADSAGMALARQGASGTRGGGALQQRLDYAETSFTRQLGLQDRGNSLAMQNMSRQYSNQWGDIGRETDSWSTGGYRYEANELSKTYAKNMYDLQIKGYTDAMDDTYDWRNLTVDYLSGVFGGAAKGAQFGAQAAGFYKQYGAGLGAPQVAALGAPLSLPGPYLDRFRNSLQPPVPGWEF